MAHEMTENDRMYATKVSRVSETESVRGAPWHIGMGTNVLMLDTAPETRQARMELAGHAWTVEEESVYRQVTREIADGVSATTYPAVPGFKLLTRSDTGTILNVPRDSYAVVQNVVGHELFEALSKGATTLVDGTGGTVKGGALCYLSARLDEGRYVIGDTSPIFPLLVVTWAHDGSGAVQARTTTLRPVCFNTVSAGELEARRTGRNFTFRHTARVLERIEEAKAVISGARAGASAFIELANELAVIPVTDAQRELFIERFIPAPVAEVVSDRVRANIDEARTKVRGIFDSPTIPEAHRNTAYGLVSAGIEYLDHLRGYRNSDTYLGRTLLRDEPLKARLVPMVREVVGV